MTKALDMENIFSGIVWSIPFSVNISIQNLEIKRDNQSAPFY